MNPAFPTLQGLNQVVRGTINLVIMTKWEDFNMNSQQNQTADTLIQDTDPLARRVARARMENREREISRILSARPRLRRLSTTATRH